MEFNFLQEQGLDTVDANRELGLPDDAREYSSVQNILADLDIKSIRLMVRMLHSLGEAWMKTFCPHLETLPSLHLLCDLMTADRCPSDLEKHFAKLKV